MEQVVPILVGCVMLGTSMFTLGRSVGRQANAALVMTDSAVRDVADKAFLLGELSEVFDDISYKRMPVACQEFNSIVDDPVTPRLVMPDIFWHYHLYQQIYSMCKEHDETKLTLPPADPGKPNAGSGTDHPSKTK